mmetsp:Transcript_23216/g.60745  ORF Transcript_23216/g.60745 Transcript_23216/m.60745 type:complete len:286 (-) Transcript_23216:190-1047(-)
MSRSELVVHFGDGLEEVFHKPEVGDLEDGGVRVRVDCSNHLRVFHPGKVLDCPRDPHRDIELRRHDLAGLPNLVVVGHVPGVHCRPRCADGSTQLVRHRVEHLEVVAVLEPAAASHHCRRRGERRAVRLGQFLPDKGGHVLCRCSLNVGSVAGATVSRRGVKVGWAHRHDLDSVVRLHLAHGIASVDQPGERVLGLDTRHLRHHRDVELCGHARQHVLADRRGPCDDVAEVKLALRSEHYGSNRLGDKACRVCLGVEHLRHASGLAGSCRGSVGLTAAHKNGYIT